MFVGTSSSYRRVKRFTDVYTFRAVYIDGRNTRIYYADDCARTVRKTNDEHFRRENEEKRLVVNTYGEIGSGLGSDRFPDAS